MIEVFALPQYPVPFPRKSVGVFKSPEEIMKKLKLTSKEVGAGLDGQIIKEQYVFEFCDSWLHQLAIDMATDAYPEGLNIEEISIVLNLQHAAVKQRWDRAKRKLKEKGVFEKLLKNIAELREIRKHKDYEFHVEGSISITVESD